MLDQDNPDAARLYVDEYMENKKGDTAYLVAMKVRVMMNSSNTNRLKLIEAICVIGEEFKNNDEMIDECINRLYKGYLDRIP